MNAEGGGGGAGSSSVGTAGTSGTAGSSSATTRPQQQQGQLATNNNDGRAVQPALHLSSDEVNYLIFRCVYIT